MRNARGWWLRSTISAKRRPNDPVPPVRRMVLFFQNEMGSLRARDDDYTSGLGASQNVPQRRLGCRARAARSTPLRLAEDGDEVEEAARLRVAVDGLAEVEGGGAAGGVAGGAPAAERHGVDDERGVQRVGERVAGAPRQVERVGADPVEADAGDDRARPRGAHPVEHR